MRGSPSTGRRGPRAPSTLAKLSSQNRHPLGCNTPALCHTEWWREATAWLVSALSRPRTIEELEPLRTAASALRMARGGRHLPSLCECLAAAESLGLVRHLGGMKADALWGVVP